MRDLHPDVAIAQPTTLANAIDQATAMDRVSATVSATLALFGIALLAIGAVGVFLSMVRGSVREIAIRLALGSSGRRLKWRIIVQALLVIVPGVIAGLGLARFAGSRLSAPLYGIDAMDPMTFAAASGLVISIGLVAAWYAASVAARSRARVVEMPWISAAAFANVTPGLR